MRTKESTLDSCMVEILDTIILVLTLGRTDVNEQVWARTTDRIRRSLDVAYEEGKHAGDRQKLEQRPVE